MALARATKTQSRDSRRQRRQGGSDGLSGSPVTQRPQVSRLRSSAAGATALLYAPRSHLSLRCEVSGTSEESAESVQPTGMASARRGRRRRTWAPDSLLDKVGTLGMCASDAGSASPPCRECPSGRERCDGDTSEPRTRTGALSCRVRVEISVWRVQQSPASVMARGRGGEGGAELGRRPFDWFHSLDLAGSLA